MRIMTLLFGIIFTAIGVYSSIAYIALERLIALPFTFAIFLFGIYLIFTKLKKQKYEDKL